MTDTPVDPEEAAGRLREAAEDVDRAARRSKPWVDQWWIGHAADIAALLTEREEMKSRLTEPLFTLCLNCKERIPFDTAGAEMHWAECGATQRREALIAENKEIKARIAAVEEASQELLHELDIANEQIPDRIMGRISVRNAIERVRALTGRDGE